MKRKYFDRSLVIPDGRKPAKAIAFEVKNNGLFSGSVQGRSFGGNITVLHYSTDVVGKGPSLHVHPYDETFVVLAGRARFYVGEHVIDAEAGEAVFGPAGLPHRFENLGPSPLQTVDIHHSPEWIQTDLD